MPNKVQLNGDSNKLVYIHTKMPLWLKRRVVFEAQTKGLDLTAYLINLLVKDVGDQMGNKESK